MLAEFMSDESVVAGLAKPVVFGDDQIAFIKNTLAEHPELWVNLGDDGLREAAYRGG